MRVELAFALLLSVLFMPLAGAYKETDHLDSTRSTHQYMMDFLPAILEYDGHAELAARLRAGWLDQLKWGSIESDRYLLRQGNHYMSPTTHAGLPGFMAAGDYADAHVAAATALWLTGDEAGAILQIGWAIEALVDLTVPHHAHLDPFNYHEPYEAWVLAHQTELPAATTGIYSLPIDPGHYGNASRAWDWVDYAAHQSYDLYASVAGPDGGAGIDWRGVASQMVPLAESLSAGLFYRMIERLDLAAPIADPGPNVIVYAGETVPLDASGSTDDVAIRDYEWRFPGNTTSTGAAASFVTTAPGTYRIELAVTDSFGKRGFANVTVTAVPLPVGGRDAAPVAVIHAPANVAPNDTVAFDGTGSSDDLGIARYEWDFGDGTRARSATAFHAYGAAGTYTVTLTVWDGAGNRNASTATIAVVTPPPPSKDAAWLAFTLLAIAVAVGIAWSAWIGRRRRLQGPGEGGA